MSIAQNQIQSEITQNTQINQLKEDKLVMKKCCDCGKVKPLTEYNLTITGKRYQAKCKDCETLLFTPKKIPKIVGHGKPLFQEYSNDDKLYKPVCGRCKECKSKTDKKKLHHGLCPACWGVKKKTEREKRLKQLSVKVANGMGLDWFTAYELSDKMNVGRAMAYRNLQMLEDGGLVETYYEDRRKYWRVV